MFSGKCNGKQSSPSGKSAIINPEFKQDFAFKLGGKHGKLLKSTTRNSLVWEEGMPGIWNSSTAFT